MHGRWRPTRGSSSLTSQRGLDVHEVAALARIIRRLADAGVTVLLVEHNFRLVCDVSDKIYVLEFGNVLAEGTSMEIQRDERVQRSYLGTSDQVSLDPIREPNDFHTTVPPPRSVVDRSRLW